MRALAVPGFRPDRSYVAASVTLVASVVLGACGVTPPTEAVSGSVSGAVTVHEGRGVPGIAVELGGTSAASATTDDEAHYSFEGLSEGSYTVEITAVPENMSFEEILRKATISGEQAEVRLDFAGQYSAVQITASETRPHAYIGRPYADTLTAAGGDEAYAWSVVAGSLPEGLSLEATTGAISGTTSTFGRVEFEVEVTSGDGQSEQLALAVTTTLHPTAKCSEHPDSAIASFEEQQIEIVVREQLGLDDGAELRCGLLATVPGLSIDSGGLSSLVGMQNLTGAYYLLLERNSIRDLSPLSDLAALELLVLAYNEIVDLTPLSGLTSLYDLTLWGNSVRDVSPLVSLQSLTELELAFNEISDVSPLAALSAVTGLGLAGNAITDVSPLASMTRLTGLSLSFNSIEDIGPLYGLPGLTHLELLGNPLVDVGRSVA